MTPREKAIEVLRALPPVEIRELMALGFGLGVVETLEAAGLRVAGTCETCRRYAHVCPGQGSCDAWIACAMACEPDEGCTRWEQKPKG